MLQIIYLISFLVALSIAQAEVVDVYFGTQGGEAKGIYRAKFDLHQGTITSTELAAEIDSPGFMAFHPDRTKLYAVAREGRQGVVAAYRIRESGELSLINKVSIPSGTAAHISVHPSGRFLLTAQYGSGFVSVFPISESGALVDCVQNIQHKGGSQVVPKRQNKPHPHWVGFSPDGRFAYVPDLGMDQIVIYRIDEVTSQLSAIGYGDALPGSGPRHMRFSIDGRFVYLLNELSVSVSTFAYASETGELTRLSTTEALTAEAKAAESFCLASEIVVHPNGTFVYSGNRGHDSVTVYEADTTSGQLSVVEVEPIRGAWPRNIQIDRAGRWLLAAGQYSNTITPFRIDSETGELTHPRGSVVNVPSVICILIND